MPAALVKSFAQKSGKSVAEVEKLWNEAKESVKKNYPDVEVDSDRYYSIVTGILKKMLDIKNSKAGEILELFNFTSYEKLGPRDMSIAASDLAKAVKGKMGQEGKTIAVSNDSDAELIVSSTEVRGEAPKSMKGKISKVIKSYNLEDNVNYV